MDTLMTTYFVYAAAAVGLTGVLARTLSNNGRIFLAEVFEDNERLARSINSLLITGFYMLNLGYAFLIFKTDEAATTIGAVENLISKLGTLLVSLGVIHFENMAVFWKIRRNAVADRQLPATFTAVVAPPPVEADYVAPNF